MERYTIHVSPDGDDADAGGIDSPLATPAVARNRARLARLEQPGRGIDIVLRGGAYRLSHGLEFLPEDSGSEHASLRVRSYPGERATLTGSIDLPEPAPIDDETVLSLLTPEQREHLRCISFSDAGIPPIDDIEQRGKPPIELYCNGVRMPISRFPSVGWLRIEDVPQDGPTRIHEGLDRERRFKDVPVGRHYGRFIYTGERPGTWGFDREVFIHGYWTWDWNDSYQMIERIDPDERAVHLAPPHHNYGYTTNQRFAFLNIVEEIDEPGKWCFHRETGRIYLWPVEGTYSAGILRSPLIKLSSASHIEFANLAFAESLGSAFEIEDASHITIAGCECTRLGDTAVVGTGEHIHIQSCDMYDLGSGGVLLSGGDRKSLAPGNNRIENNHIHHFSTWVRTYKHAVSVDGVGSVVAHNLIHDCPQEAITFRGNDHLIEYNEIHTVTTETGDSGAIHTGRDWTWRDTILRFNFIHGLSGPGLHGSMGIYLDDFMSGTTIYGNIFYRAGRAAFVGGGRDNIIKNNIFIECKASVHVDARGTSWAANYFDGRYPVLFEAMDRMDFRNPPYSERYPVLLELYDDDPAFPKHNYIASNVSFGGKWLDLNDTVRVGDLGHEKNYIADEILCSQLRADIDTDPYFLNIDTRDSYETITGAGAGTEKIEVGENVIRTGAIPVPEWKDRKFAVDREVAEEIGFVQIPYEKIGLYLDAYRRELPAVKPL